VGVAVEDAVDRLGTRVLPFADPDGLALELIEAEDDRRPWQGDLSGTIPADKAVRGFYGVTLGERDPNATAAVLTGVMGYRQTAEENGRLRFEIAAGGAGTIVDLIVVDRPHSSALGPGVTHHVAFRTPDEAQQDAWIDRLFSGGLQTTAVQDREYFHSIYFREPGGVLFEIATDTPGFTVDESREDLGRRLCLPPWLEPQRGQIERVLPKITVAGTGEGSHEQH
jgi:glyoxalase family protein